MKKSKKRNYAIIVLLILLIAIAVGYAAFQTVLNINGTATAKTKWDVKFTDAKLIGSDNKEANSEKYGSVSFTDTTVTATGIKLSYPGDAVKLRTVISNLGDLNAKLTKTLHHSFIKLKILQAFKHLIDALFLLFHIRMHIKIKCCAYVCMPQNNTYRFIVALAFYTTSGKGMSQAMKLQIGNI